MMTGVTEHAAKRIKRRIGHSRSQEQFGEALLHGTSANDFKGNFRRYLDAQRIQHQSDCIVYKGMLYWHKKTLLITVFGVPQRFRKYESRP